ncbi:MAG: sensor histidine kinase [Spirochaetaceae bacterium]|nr:MAG: sensor histidine kinase [Spirochaetaceae bacterium]
MESLRRDKILFISLVSLLVVLVSVGLLAFILRSRDHDQLFMEYQAVRMAAAAMEVFQHQGDIAANQFPETVRGFGVYSADGNPVMARGSVPRVLPSTVVNDPAPYQTIIDGNTLRLLRVVGTMSYPGDRSRRLESPNSATAESRMSRQFIVLDYDISSYRSEFRARTLYWSGLTVSFFLLLALVWTLYRRVQDYQIQEQKQRGLVQLGAAARTLTHEIRNPLGAIQIQNAVLKRKLPEGFHNSLEVFDEEIGRIALLVDRVRDFLQSGAGNVEPVDIVDMLQSLAQRFEFDVNLVLPKHAVPVAFDRARLRSVFENVIKNAGESMNGEGQVDITVTEDRRSATVMIADRGSGVAKSDQDRIFDPFFTTKSGGSGVGLAITRQFLTMMGGSIELSDRPGGGSEFRIILKKERTRAIADR